MKRQSTNIFSDGTEIDTSPSRSSNTKNLKSRAFAIANQMRSYIQRTYRRLQSLKSSLSILKRHGGSFGTSISLFLEKSFRGLKSTWSLWFSGMMLRYPILKLLPYDRISTWLRKTKSK